LNFTLAAPTVLALVGALMHGSAVSVNYYENGRSIMLHAGFKQQQPASIQPEKCRQNQTSKT
jgi:hypothetical protein